MSQHFVKRKVNYLLGLVKDVHLKELLAGSTISFFAKALGTFLWYFYIFLITRNLGAEAMGIFSISFTVLHAIALIPIIGLDMALVRFVSEYASLRNFERIKELYLLSLRVIVTLGFFVSVALFFSASFLANAIFGNEELTRCLQIVSIAILPLALISLNLGGLRGLKRIVAYSFLHDVLIFLMAAIILAIFMINSSASDITISSYVVSIFIVMPVSFIVWMKYSKFHSTSYKRTVTINSVLKISTPMMLSSSIVLIMGWTDTLMLGILKTEYEVGIYSVALKIATLTGGALFAINTIAAPKFAELYGHKDMSGLEKVAQQSTKLIFWCSAPVLLIMVLVPSQILGIFGEDFKKGVFVLMVLAFGQFVSSISGSVGYLLQMTGGQAVHQNIVLTSAAINIVLNLILIPPFGINGAAVASMVSLIFRNLCSLVYVKKRLNVKTFYFPFIYSH